MDNLGDRIKFARHNHPDGKMTQGVLAKLSGISQTTVADIERGRNSGTTKIVDIARVLKVSVSWLNSGKGDMRTGAQSQTATTHGATVRSAGDDEENPLISRIRKVKLKISAGISGFAIDPDFEDGNPIYFRKDWIESRGYKVNNLIAIVVQGQSMEPTLNHGDTVVINTADVQPKDGDVYAINYEGEAIVKRMIRDSGVWWLSSDNQDKNRYPMKQCSGDGCIVIGKVVHKQSEHI
mgnify:CR=1 FL=1